MIVKNEDLLTGLHKFVIKSLPHHTITKDLIRILVKFNENLLKDVNGIATSSNNNMDTQYVFSTYLLNNASHGEDDNSLIKSHSNDNFDICNFTYVFVTVSSSVDAIAKDFVDDSEEILIDSTFNQRRKVLGLRRYYIKC